MLEQRISSHPFGEQTERQAFYGEFDPGSERTLAACLTHASRARKRTSVLEYSGRRVSNTWVIYPSVRDNSSKGLLIPYTAIFSREYGERLRSPMDEPATHQVVGRVMAYQAYDA